jgi:type IV pilus assembly protein PilC
MILLFIVPRYVDLFVSMHKDLPAATQMLVKLHTFIRSYYLVGSLSILAALLCIVIRWKYSLSTKKWSDRLLLRSPWIGSLLEKVYVVQFLQSLALLLQGGIALVPALEITHRSMRNLYVKDQIGSLLKKVQNGQSLGDAMQSSQPTFFAQDLILLTIVGEQSASVSMMMQRAAQIYQKQIEQKIAKYTIILQPLLMIILGLLVATLIFAVYMPLFNLAESI